MSKTSIEFDRLVNEFHRWSAGLRERVTEFAGGLSREQLEWRPAPGAWSIAECVDHLTVTTNEFTDAIRRGIFRSRQRNFNAKPGRIARQTLAGRLLTHLVSPDSARKYKTPAVLQPRPGVSGHVVERFFQAQSRLEQIVSATEGLDLNRIRFGSPMTPLLNLNAAETLIILSLHTERHLEQAERIAAAKGFPG